MDTETTFDPHDALILVTAIVRGPKASRTATLIVDTGATYTMLVHELIEAIGYSSRDGGVQTTVTTAIGREHGYTLRVARFEALGFVEDDFVVHVFDLAERGEIEGLLGLNFLARLNYEVRSIEGRILAERAAALATP